MPADQLTPPGIGDPRTETAARLPGRDSDWAQVTIEFTDWEDAPLVVAEHIQPVLPLGRWWFIRKHPRWRLRHQPDEPALLPRRLATLSAEGVICGWYTSIYEPETHAFGGPVAMTVAHEQFCRDSPTALALTLPTPPATGGRAELSILAINRMLRAAALEPYEQGDVWALLAELRHGAEHAGSNGAALGAPAALRRLLTLDTGATSTLMNGPLTPLRGWLDAFTATGHRLAHLARTGQLTRGLRAVLAYHVLFHWNRIDLPTAHQETLARLARDNLIPPDTTPAR
jgi:protein-L-isoaspartate(D-aspartate) O-methyltransferase